MDLNKKLKELKPQQLNCNVFDVYSYNGLTMQDLLCQFFTTINECVKSTNEVIDLTDWLVNVGLEEEVAKKLMGLIKDGTIENLINVNLFKSLNNNINDFGVQLEQNKKDLTNKINEVAELGTTEEVLKTTTEGYIQKKLDDGTIANLTIEDNTITNKKYKDMSVTPIKTSFITHTETEQLIDVMPIVLSQKGDFYSPDDGNLYNTDGTQGYKNTGKIYIKSKKYMSKGVAYIMFYDLNDNFISSLRVTDDNTLINVVQEIVPPENAHYMICDIPTIFWWDRDNTGQIYDSLLYEVRDRYKYEKSLITNENLILTDSYFLPKQIYDNNNINNGKYNLITGIVENDNTGQYKYTGLIPCYDVDYKFYGIRDILYFDEYYQYTGKYISHSTDDLMANLQTVRPVRGAKYMAFNVLKYYWERSEVFQLQDFKKVCKLENTYIENKVDCLNKYSGKTIINFGDSIFGNFNAPGDISTIISHNLNCNAINMGFGGTRISSHLQNASFDKFSFYNLVNSIVSNDFTLQENVINASGIPSYYKDRIAKLKTIDWSKVTLITIAYGTNDWNGANLIENSENLKDTKTYKGAFRYSIEKLLTKYPHLKIVICTPIYRFKEDLTMDSDDEWIDITTGQKLPQFVQACKDIGKEYKLKVIDNYYEIGINKFNRMYYFNTVDGTHPNYNGRKLIADNISFNI